ncbi:MULTISPECIES: MetQ/NlpA family ABC transporter substrate-binding protein [unclassified Streptomyces]|uniref:Lipoprotein n=1 Tax=Streptomyces evansiae TaxID=3075535 RepID=A0ABU2R1I5_9ACTN|nr:MULTISPECIES: MetQ/NlpA family ABC transporter substrate-binding protein [unclassified Streptomyces]MYQ56701.1 metal ABC transporter substrate-binding protein [Streptomyces sp. SID4926]MYR27959.1 metal ABC transporter substrate-binding protein [Streptomyces sp. SID4945]MDT0410559.1 MetQ/NlpA family ABC transporter substrate-binding protein [Streptomyces sp. DSM 41979]SCE10276.1 D-methionine transport system substrate-binding protein [Streptomyces sp. DfronAA-171]SCE12591.1 D-methionine tran
MRNHTRRTTRIATAVAVAGALGLGLAACGSDDDSAKSGSGDSDKALVVAASPTPHADILKYVQDHLAAKDGLKLKVKEVTDYVTPNTATQDGSVDANFFQHKPYLDDFNKKNGTDLVPVTAVHLEPLGAYSHKVKSLDALKKGATVALPNDATNEARALKLLESNGLITLKSGAGDDATPSDIAKNPKNISFKELEAAQVPRSLDDVDAAVVNGNYAVETGLKPAKDALVLEKAKDNPYANLLVVKDGKENDPRVKKLAKLLHSPEVKKFIEDKYEGSVIPAF